MRSQTLEKTFQGLWNLAIIRPLAGQLSKGSDDPLSTDLFVENDRCRFWHGTLQPTFQFLLAYLEPDDPCGRVYFDDSGRGQVLVVKLHLVSITNFRVAVWGERVGVNP